MRDFIKVNFLPNAYCLKKDFWILERKLRYSYEIIKNVILGFLMLLSILFVCISDSLKVLNIRNIYNNNVNSNQSIIKGIIK